MKPMISNSLFLTTLCSTSVLLSSLLGCSAGQLTTAATRVVMLYSEPVGCENLGDVTATGGGLSGAYSKPSVNRESAENEALNQAAELGATHMLLHPEELEQGDGRGPTEQDTEPAMAHGYGTGSTVIVSGTAYKCPPNMQPPKAVASGQSGGAFVAVQPPTAISMAPLGQLTAIHVFQRVPLPSGAGMGEEEVLSIVDSTEIQRVVDSLANVAQDPMKYIPTHRIEFVGELGVQSLLYGFGYLQYAGGVYRLTNGDFEEVLGLRDAPTAD